MVKQHTITKAYQALVRLSYMNLPIKTAYSVYTLMGEIEPAYQCGAKLEQDILTKLNMKVEGDRIVPPDEETLNQYVSNMKELNDMDVNVEFHPVKICCEDLGDQKMKPSDMKALEGFVSFC